MLGQSGPAIPASPLMIRCPYCRSAQPLSPQQVAIQACRRTLPNRVTGVRLVAPPTCARRTRAMMTKPFRLYVIKASLVLALSSLSAHTSLAEQLYRWTDEQGRVHFSDRAPEGSVAGEVEALPTPQFADPDTTPDTYSVMQQWQRLSAERQAQERARQEQKYRSRELALRQREVAAVERAAEQPVTRTGVWGPVWPVPPIHRPGHPPGQGPGHRPGKPPTQLPSQGLWKRDHPAYRPHSRHPGHRATYGAEIRPRR
jgi:hypothetical protein